MPSDSEMCGTGIIRGREKMLVIVGGYMVASCECLFKHVVSMVSGYVGETCRPAVYRSHCSAN